MNWGKSGFPIAGRSEDVRNLTIGVPAETPPGSRGDTATREAILRPIVEDEYGGVMEKRPASSATRSQLPEHPSY